LAPTVGIRWRSVFGADPEIGCRAQPGQFCPGVLKLPFMLFCDQPRALATTFVLVITPAAQGHQHMDMGPYFSATIVVSQAMNCKIHDHAFVDELAIDPLDNGIMPSVRFIFFGE
jgi:hypothetical protein